MNEVVLAYEKLAVSHLVYVSLQLRNPTFHYPVYKITPLDAILSQMNL
jgi:hypothetical protein